MHKKNKGNKTPIKDTNEDLRIEYKQEESEDETPIEKKAKTEKDSESVFKNFVLMWMFVKGIFG